MVVFGYWYIFLLIFVLVILLSYLSLKFKIETVDDLVECIYVIVNTGKNKSPGSNLFLTKNEYPTTFEWLSPNEYTFGKYGSIVFRDGNNDNRNVFQILTEAKGEYVRVQKIAHLTSHKGSYVRTILNNLSRRIKKDPRLAHFVDIISNNEGAYKLAVKPSILKQ